MYIGKTTLSKKLLDMIPNSITFSQDDFYHKRDESHYQYIAELDSFNFDVITAIDMTKFHIELGRLVRSGLYEWIFLDGILLYDDAKLVHMLDRRYFIDLDKEECARRRQSRNYIIADTAGYFDLCAWKEFTQYKARCEQVDQKHSIIYIDGTDAPENILSFVLDDLRDVECC